MNTKIAQLMADVEWPATVDTAGVCEIVEGLEGQKPAEETVRRWPLRYKIIGRKRIYEVADIIAHRRQRYEQAPVRRAAVPRRRAAKTGQTI
jgi:hypothetical protein